MFRDGLQLASIRLCASSVLFTSLDSRRDEFGSRWCVLFWAVRFSTLTHYPNSYIPRCSSIQLWHLLWCSNQMHSVWQLYVQNLNWLIHLSETGMCPRPLTDVSTGLVEIPTRGKRHVNYSCSKKTYILNIVCIETIWLPIHRDHTCFKKS